MTALSIDVEEADLIRRAKSGEQAAWEYLVRKYQEPVFRIAYLLLADADAAEDVAQETFLRAFRSLGSFDVSRPIRPWLVTIAANQSRNLRRAAGRYWRAVQRTAIESEVDAPANRSPDFDRRLLQEDLWQAIRRLGHSDQEIIYYRYFLELPVSETASALGIADGTVKSRLSRALERLERIIEREFPLLIEEGFGS